MTFPSDDGVYLGRIPGVRDEHPPPLGPAGVDLVHIKDEALEVIVKNPFLNPYLRNITGHFIKQGTRNMIGVGKKVKRQTGRKQGGEQGQDQGGRSHLIQADPGSFEGGDLVVAGQAVKGQQYGQ